MLDEGPLMPGFSARGRADDPVRQRDRLRYRLLGPLVALRGDHDVSPRQPRDRTLLTLLLLHRGATVSLDALVDCVWGERPPASARHSIQTMVWRLRAVLGTEEIDTSGPGYSMPDPIVDIDEVEALVAEARARAEQDPQLAVSLFGSALAMWRGEPLLDAAYADWAQPEAHRLGELRSAVAFERLSGLVGLECYDEAVPELEAFVTANPYQERAWALLIVALCRMGRAADALRSYRRVERLLVEDLGVSPSQELRQLEYLVLADDPELQGSWTKDFMHRGPVPWQRRRHAS